MTSAAPLNLPSAISQTLVNGPSIKGKPPGSQATAVAGRNLETAIQAYPKQVSGPAQWLTPYLSAGRASIASLLKHVSAMVEPKPEPKAAPIPAEPVQVVTAAATEVKSPQIGILERVKNAYKRAQTYGGHPVCTRAIIVATAIFLAHTAYGMWHEKQTQLFLPRSRCKPGLDGFQIRASLFIRDGENHSIERGLQFNGECNRPQPLYGTFERNGVKLMSGTFTRADRESCINATTGFFDQFIAQLYPETCLELTEGTEYKFGEPLRNGTFTDGHFTKGIIYDRLVSGQPWKEGYFTDNKMTEGTLFDYTGNPLKKGYFTQDEMLINGTLFQNGKPWKEGNFTDDEKLASGTYHILPSQANTALYRDVTTFIGNFSISDNGLERLDEGQVFKGSHLWKNGTFNTDNPFYELKQGTIFSQNEEATQDEGSFEIPPHSWFYEEDKQYYDQRTQRNLERREQLHGIGMRCTKVSTGAAQLWSKQTECLKGPFEYGERHGEFERFIKTDSGLEYQDKVMYEFDKKRSDYALSHLLFPSSENEQT